MKKQNMMQEGSIKGWLDMLDEKKKALKTSTEDNRRLQSQVELLEKHQKEMQDSLKKMEASFA